MQVQSERSGAIPPPGLADLVFGWDLAPVVRRAADRMGWTPSYAAEVEREYRRFLYLSVARPGEKLGMAGPVDELWHEHILDTIDYVEFCRQASGRYLHHTPQGETGGTGSEYALTLASIDDYFGEPNWNVWPRIAAPGKGCCSNCSHVTGLEAGLLPS